MIGCKRPETCYFDAWRERSTDQILAVICEDVEYRLREDKVLHGREELENYWNKEVVKRQSQVDVLETPLRQSENSSQYIFVAEFHDNEVSAHQKLLGNIEFEIDEEGKIKKIFETYNAVRGDGPKEIVKPLKTSAKLLLQGVFSTDSLVKLVRLLYRVTLLFSAAFVLFLLATFIPLFVSFLEVVGIADPQNNRGVDYLRSSTLNWFPAMGIAAIITSALERWAEARGGISNITRKTRQAEEVLASHLRSADKAVIMGGDFSYIRSSKNLLDQLERLSLRGDLLMLSSCSENVILSANSRSSKTIDLLQRMISYGQLRENSNPNNHRFGLMEAGEERRLILKTDNGVLVFKKFRGSSSLLQLLMDVVDEAYKRLSY